LTSFYKTADSFKQGSRTLPQRYYIEDLLLEEEMEIFFKIDGFVLEEVMK